MLSYHVPRAGVRRRPAYSVVVWANSLRARSHVSTSKCASSCPPLAPITAVRSSQGASLAFAHLNTSACPRSAAAKHVHSFHGQKRSRAYRKPARFPTLAAFAHVYLLQTQPFWCTNSRSRRSSWIAAAALVRVHGHPFARKNRSISRWPPPSSRGAPSTRPKGTRSRVPTSARADGRSPPRPSSSGVCPADLGVRADAARPDTPAPQLPAPRARAREGSSPPRHRAPRDSPC